MSSSLTPPEAYEPEPARRSLVALVEQLLLETLDGASAPGCALRVEMPVRRTDAQAWLRAQDAEEKAYWADRSGAFEIAGVGSADTLMDATGDGSSVFARMRERLACAHPGLRYLGGLRFNPRVSSSDAWRPFGACRFVLPRFELTVADGRAHLACNLIAPEQARVDELFEEIHTGLQALQFPEPDASDAALERPFARSDCPDREGWTRTINEALTLLDSGELEKIVLARESRFDFASASDAGELLRRLTRRVGRAYRFYFQPARGSAFLGASPERLYKRHGRHLESEAVAGTRPRGRTPEEDEAFSRELLASEKDVREHRFVVDALVAGFASLCGAVQRGDELSLLRLSECQHLHRRIEGILADACSDTEILRVLHPTPAVGGSPKREAMDWIARLEGFDRGWYAGPVGWVSREAAEFAVAIRCGLVHGASISVYSGAGIVPGSTPEGEWDEIEGKMSNLSRVLVGDEV